MRKLRENISDLLRNTLSNSPTHYDMSMTPHRCNLVLPNRYFPKIDARCPCSFRVFLARQHGGFAWFSREHDRGAKQLPSQSPGPRLPFLFSAPNQNRHATQASQAWINSARKLAYSHAGSARKNRLFGSKFCSVSEKVFGSQGRIYFRKYSKEPGPNP